jgi:hypothetical protein
MLIPPFAVKVTSVSENISPRAVAINVAHFGQSVSQWLSACGVTWTHVS